MTYLNFVRENIKNLVSYRAARESAQEPSQVLLDANELPFNTGYNRYPLTVNRRLKEAASRRWSLGSVEYSEDIQSDNVFISNGSDEAIDLLIRVFCEPGINNIASVSPTYGMYKVLSAINNVEYRELKLSEDFDFSSTNLLEICDSNTSLIFICSPNNPTGNLFNKGQIIKLAQNFRGVVVVDEAYIDFSGDTGLIPQIKNLSNLVVLRTMSKSSGMAGIRLGFAYARKEIVDILERVKYPYNVNSMSQDLALKSFNESVCYEVDIIINERERLARSLLKIPSVLRVFRSDTNFLLVKFRDSKEIFEKLQKNSIIVRDRGNEQGCSNCLRITVGKPQENNLLLSVLSNETIPEINCVSTVVRVTNETGISLKLFKSDTLNPQIFTGIGFFDHMLNLLSFHSGLAAEIDVKGDLYIDAHHTIEDVAIVYGEALKKHISKLKGFNRYGFVLPMDESIAEVVLDICRRGYLKWDVKLSAEKMGEFPAEMLEHFFYSLAINAQIALHIRAEGENNHHIAECIFKSVGRALRIAFSNDIGVYEVPSTKGVL